MTRPGGAGPVERLGLSELAAALERVWAKPIYEHVTAEERLEALNSLRKAAADTTNASEFNDDDIRPIDDPVDAVAWVDKRAKAMAEWDDERADQDDEDAAEAVRLTDDERDWLAGFLVSRQAPGNAMTFEEIDGFFTALVVGPEMVMPSEYMPEIWGTDDGSGPTWDGTEQAEYFFALLMKHWNAIAARRKHPASTAWGIA